MSSAETPAPALHWQDATVVAIVEQTPTVKSFMLAPLNPFAFVAGQHVDIRLTAPDGYQAQRSYSIGSAPDDSGVIEIVVERLEDGEVSPFFHDVVAVGDPIEIARPDRRPLQLDARRRRTDPPRRRRLGRRAARLDAPPPLASPPRRRRWVSSTRRAAGPT